LNSFGRSARLHRTTRCSQGSENIVEDVRLRFSSLILFDEQSCCIKHIKLTLGFRENVLIGKQTKAVNHRIKFGRPYETHTNSLGYNELFGGFVLDATDREQLASLAAKPVEAVSEALDILDVFYPTKNGWHTVSKELRMMKMIPAYRRGIGAFMRKVSRNLESYSAVAPKMCWLVGNWHNAALRILEQELMLTKTK
jgi:hypothetical protein